MKSIKIIGVVILPVLAAFVFFGYGFACGFSMGPSFGCTLALPLSGLGILVGILCAILIIIGIARTGNFLTSRKTAITFFVALIVPAALLLIYDSLPREARYRIFDGVNPSTCASGKPMYPWGVKLSPDSCYASFGMCNKVDEPGQDYRCFDQNGALSKYEDCDVLKSEYSKTQCRVNVARSLNDLNFCSTLVDAEGALYNPYGPRHDCAVKVLGAFDDTRGISAVGVDSTESKINRCKSLGGKIADVCIEDLLIITNPTSADNICSSISNEIPWLRQNCRDLSKLRGL